MTGDQGSTHLHTRYVERTLRELDMAQLIRGRRFYPSPAAWEDEVLYFLMVDRFSDGGEAGGFADLEGRPVPDDAVGRRTALFRRERDEGSAPREAWARAGRGWCGGTLAGLRDKVGYLKRLGVTAVWLSPIFRQVAGSLDYHGYGVQNFLDVEPRFGTREELKAFVGTAHGAGIRVILDIILNHAGDVFAYREDHAYDYHRGERWPVQGYRLEKGDPGSLPFGPVDTAAHPEAWPDGAVWPAEFQTAETWTRQGRIRNWDAFPEYLDGDFFDFKELALGEAPREPGLVGDHERRIREFRPSAALVDLARVFSFWIAYADIDGFRLDTVKHMEPGAVRFFTTMIHEFAQSIGKEDFYVIGEVTGGRANAVTTVDATGLDAALGINDMPDLMEFLVKGWRNPGGESRDEEVGYFDLFRNSLQDYRHSHRWYAKHIVTMFDDHDQVGVKHKFRFCGDREDSRAFLRAALGLNLTTAGIPCVYYGSEQAFNGFDDRRGNDDEYSDVFLRECMFGGPFGSYQSVGRHFFDEHHEAYRFMAEVCQLRRQRLPLRRGRQFLRQVSHDGSDFYLPRMIGGQLRWVVAWSRIFAGEEIVCAINTDPTREIAVWCTVDRSLWRPGEESLVCLLSTADGGQGREAPVEARNGAAVRILVPPAGFVVYGRRD